MQQASTKVSYLQLVGSVFLVVMLVLACALPSYANASLIRESSNLATQSFSVSKVTSTKYLLGTEYTNVSESASNYLAPGTYTFNCDVYGADGTDLYWYLQTYDAENNTVNKTQGYFDNLPITFNLPSSVQSYKFGFLGSQDVISNIRLSNIMLNKGTEALPYEPAGQSKLDLDPYLPEFSDYLTDSLLIAVPGALGLTGVIAGIRIGLRKFRSVV